MKKPQGYDEAKVGMEAFEAGGHLCEIKAVEEVKSSTGKEGVAVYIDTTAEDAQPGYWEAKYNANTNTDKKWPCIWRSYEGAYHAQNLKRMITAIEHSNDGFTFTDRMWEDLNLALKGKKVGVVFRYEQFVGDDSAIYASCKPWQFRAYDKVLEVPVPDVKSVLPAPTLTSPAPAFANAPTETWITVDNLEDEGLPFS